MAPEYRSDELLIKQMAQRDTEALELLYERHAQIVYNLILRIVRDPVTADELLHDTFWHAWQGAADFRAAGVVAAWLYSTLR